MTKAPFDRIHHINHLFNRLFSVPLYLFSWAIVCLLVLMPYTGRLVIAFLINLVFNRPRVYLNYFSRMVARPLNMISTVVFYIGFFGIYSVIGRVFAFTRRCFGGGKVRSNWHPAAKPTDERTGYYLS